MVGAMQVFQRGATITTGGTSARVAIPKTSSSNTLPKYVRLAATAACYARLDADNTGTAAAGDVLVQPGDAVILCVAGYTYVSAIQVTGAGILQISPLEDQ